MRCYTEECDFDLEALGNEAWQTGCPLCGDSCWLPKGPRSEKEIQEIDEYLDKLYVDIERKSE
jgi:hypothetical protein